MDVEALEELGTYSWKTEYLKSSARWDAEDATEAPWYCGTLERERERERERETEL